MVCEQVWELERSSWQMVWGRERERPMEKVQTRNCEWLHRKESPRGRKRDLVQEGRFFEELG